MKSLSLFLLAVSVAIPLFFSALPPSAAIENISVLNVDGDSTSQRFSRSISPQEYLFPVVIDNKTGFIDSLGQLAIPPLYEGAQEFSEGLCAVRMNGLYGFINNRGEMVIEPTYDYATAFIEGLALVFVYNKPCFIDHNGKVIIPTHYKEMIAFTNGLAHVMGNSGKAGVINKTGKLVIDTLYGYISRFEGGLAVVQKFLPRDDTYHDEEMAIIDSSGNLVVPFGKYTSIRGPYDGFFIGDPVGNGTAQIFDKTGKIFYSLRKGQSDWSGAALRDGVFRISTDGRNNENRDLYITPTGRVVYKNRKVNYGEDFSDRHAFWRGSDHHYFMINTRGKIVGDYDNLKGNGFVNGYALVKKDGKWGVIDTTGQFLFPPVFDDVAEQGVVGQYIFFQQPDFTYTDEDPNAKYGVADLRGNIIIPPTFHFFDSRGFIHGVLKTSTDRHVVFFNAHGDKIFEERSEKPYAYDIDFMQRGYVYVSGENTGHPSPYGAAPELIPAVHSFPQRGISVMVVNESETTIDNEIKGMPVFIANTSSDTMAFNAQDGRLYMKMQALDTEGNWRDIEYLPSSWCGNSYHTILLPGNHLWKVNAIKYGGSFKTKLRMELKCIDLSDTTGDVHEAKQRRISRYRFRNKREITIYSNVFDGSINPGQFWRKREYFPNGIMDPYND